MVYKMCKMVIIELLFLLKMTRRKAEYVFSFYTNMFDKHLHILLHCFLSISFEGAIIHVEIDSWFFAIPGKIQQEFLRIIHNSFVTTKFLSELQTPAWLMPERFFSFVNGSLSSTHQSRIQSVRVAFLILECMFKYAAPMEDIPKYLPNWLESF